MLKYHIQNNCLQNMNLMSFACFTQNHHHLKLTVHSDNLLLIFLVLSSSYKNSVIDLVFTKFSFIRSQKLTLVGSNSLSIYSFTVFKMLFLSTILFAFYGLSKMMVMVSQ